MTHIAILLLLTAHASATDWQRMRDPTAMAAASSFDVSPNAFFEVTASTLGRALTTLADEPLVALAPPEVSSYSQGHFACRYPESAYLVRAIYENEATGSYTIKSSGKALWVSHSSLGPATGQHKSAIVVCLMSRPETVFVTASGAL